VLHVRPRGEGDRSDSDQQATPIPAPNLARKTAAVNARAGTRHRLAGDYVGNSSTGKEETYVFHADCHSATVQNSKSGFGSGRLVGMTTGDPCTTAATRPYLKREDEHDVGEARSNSRSKYLPIDVGVASRSGNRREQIRKALRMKDRSFCERA